MRPRSLLAVAALASACASTPAGPAPTRATDFRPIEIRQPAIFVRVSFGAGVFSERERRSLPAEYEGALLEALNTRAVLARDVRVVDAAQSKVDPASAVARAREVRADHAIVVEVRVSRGDVVFCRESRRPVRGPATVWSQEATVLRASDGAVRLTLVPGPHLDVADVDVDCENPRASQRRGAAETIGATVDKLLARLLGA
jgi:hypothetical protein